jgi:hypothetical protein
MKKITEEENKVRSNVYKTYYTDYVIRANGCERAGLHKRNSGTLSKLGRLMLT